MTRIFPILMLFAGLGSSISPAQAGIVDCVGQPIVHVARLRGWVYDPTGVAIPSITLTLKAGDHVVAQTTSDEEGRFELQARSGKYELDARSAYFRAIPLTIHVGPDTHTIFRSGQMRWILQVAGVNCSWATTSPSEFNKEIRLYKERHKRDTENNATQK